MFKLSEYSQNAGLIYEILTQFILLLYKTSLLQGFFLIFTHYYFFALMEIMQCARSAPRSLKHSHISIRISDSPGSRNPNSEITPTQQKKQNKNKDKQKLNRIQSGQIGCALICTPNVLFHLFVFLYFLNWERAK